MRPYKVKCGDGTTKEYSNQDLTDRLKRAIQLNNKLTIEITLDLALLEEGKVCFLAKVLEIQGCQTYHYDFDNFMKYLRDALSINLVDDEYDEI